MEKQKNLITSISALLVAVIGVLAAFGVISTEENKALVQIVGPLVAIVVGLVLARAGDKGNFFGL